MYFSSEATVQVDDAMQRDFIILQNTKRILMILSSENHSPSGFFFSKLDMTQGTDWQTHCLIQMSPNHH